VYSVRPEVIMGGHVIDSSFVRKESSEGSSVVELS
jgi:hypothetical protein